MPGIVQLSKKELDELIESVEAEGGDSTELKKLRAQFVETQPQKPARRMVIQLGTREEGTTEERLNREADDLLQAASRLTYWPCVLGTTGSTA